MMVKLYEISTSAWHIFLDFGQVEKILFPDYGDRVKAMKNQKISFTSYKEKKAGDIANFTGIYCGFSKKFIDLMENHGISNFKEYPLKIIFPENCPTYYYLDINCNPIRRLTKKKKGLMDLETIFFDIGDWGGEDLFKVEDTLGVLCTEKVKKLVEKAKLKNFRFTEIKPV